MKKVLTEKLPRWKDNKYKGKINWKKCIGYKVKFIYDDIEGEIEIIDCWKKNKKTYLKIKYKNIFGSMETSNFSNGKLGKSLKLYKKKYINLYKYKVGDIITNICSGKLQILEQIRMDKKNSKGYRYKCLICGNEDTIDECNLKDSHRGCSVCSGKKVLIGYNDMWSTNSELAKLLLDPEDGYKYMQNSNKYVDWKCPECGNIIKHKLIVNINKRGLSCPKCSDNISYPNKFIFSVLQQLLNDNFENEKVFNWGKNYRYDFYFKINNGKYIVEAQGLQHYQDEFSRIKSNRHTRTVEEEQENDRLKKELALKNGIKKENYIVIDCRESTLEWIKEHILQSRLAKLFDLSKIDWLECHEFACSSFIKKACNLWNNGVRSTVKIGSIMKLTKTTIRKYLKQGTLLNWCNYDPKEVQRNNGKNFGHIKKIK